MEERLIKFCVCLLMIPVVWIVLLLTGFVLVMVAGILLMIGVLMLGMPIIALIWPQGIQFNYNKKESTHGRRK